MSKENSKLSPDSLKEMGKEITYASTKGIISSFPIVGPFLSEIFQISVDSPYQKRLENFIFKIAEKLEMLEKNQKLTVEYLKANKEFLDILIQASDIGVKNSQEEKHEMLKNAVINTALGIDISSNEKYMFLRLINDITPLHYKILRMFYYPEEHIQKILEIIIEREDMKRNVIIPNSFNELINVDSSLFDKIIHDLQTWNLIKEVGQADLGFPTWDINEMKKHTVSTIIERQNYFGKKFFVFIEDYNK